MFPNFSNPVIYAEWFFTESFGDCAWHWALREGTTGSVTRGCDRRVRLGTGSSEVSVRVAGKALVRGDLEHGPTRQGEQRKCPQGTVARAEEGAGARQGRWDRIHEFAEQRPLPPRGGRGDRLLVYSLGFKGERWLRVGFP